MPRINVRLNGRLGSAGEEVWSCGFNFRTDSAPDFAEANALAVDIAGALSAGGGDAFGSLVNGMSASASVNDVDVYVYDGTGPAVAAGSAPLPVAVAGGGPPTAPPQSASVVSLLTALPGARHRGRFYWPCLAPAMTTSLRSSTTQGHSTGAVELLAAIAGQMVDFGNPLPVVYSPTSGDMTPVIAARAGNVVDTQRRRRDSLVESFTTSQYLG